MANPKIVFYPERRRDHLGVLRVRNVPLLLFFSLSGKRLQYFTGERIDLKDWDFEKRQVLSSHPEHISLNRHLEFLKRKVLEVHRDLNLSGQAADVPLMRSKLKEVLKKGNSSFFDLLILFIEEKNSEWTLSTYRKVKTFYNHLRNFNSKTGIEPDLAGMDDQFLEKLTNYFRNDCKHIDSTIRKNFELLMWFMNWAQKKGLHRNFAFRMNIDKYISLNTGYKEEFFLTTDEIRALIKYSPQLQKEVLARDVFVFACFTGLSCQELRMLKPENIEDDLIKITSGSRKRTVPLIPPARTIIERYLQREEISLFHKIYAAKINRFLKEMAKKSGLNREISITKFTNGLPQDANAPLYMLLTLSVARKTFIQLALDFGINPLTVARAVGYKSMAVIDGQTIKSDKSKYNEFKDFNI